MLSTLKQIDAASRPPAPVVTPATLGLPAVQTPPSPDYTAEQAVAIQLAALQRNNEPWGNHGVQVSGPGQSLRPR